MKFKLYPLLLLIFITASPGFIIAQDFDEAFLKSLPEDVATDLQMRANEKKSSEEVQYRRPSTFINKPDQLSARFGARVFSMMQSSLMPINEPNFDGSYILDYGDELELQLTGQKSLTTKLPIRRDGTVNIEDIGKIYLSGLSLNEAANLIKIKINESFIGVDSYLTLINVRDIQVILAGNVYNPGPYVLNGNSNIFNALSVAGGPSDMGSYRSIDLIRDNKIFESYDLYDTFIYGKSNFKTRLRSGDIVFINSVNNIVSVVGGVKRPGEYELFDGEKLSAVLFFANGLNKFADKTNIKLYRILDGSIKGLPITSISQFADIESNDGDSLFIRSFPFRSVSINGAVINPGKYLMNEGDSIFDVVEKAGGFSKNAYSFGVIYENQAALAINTKAIDALYIDFLDNILTFSSQLSAEIDLSTILEITSQIKSTPPSGRVIADFTDINQENPVLISDGDKITVPEYQNQVFVFGETASSGSALFSENQDINFYLNKKGGLSSNADKKNIYVVYPNGESFRATWNKNVFVKQGKEIKIHPGSIIFVPRKLDDSSSNRLRAQAYATILGNLGVSLASLSVLKD